MKQNGFQQIGERLFGLCLYLERCEQRSIAVAVCSPFGKKTRIVMVAHLLFSTLSSGKSVVLISTQKHVRPMTVCKLKIENANLDHLVNYLVGVLPFDYENHSTDMSVLMVENLRLSNMTNDKTCSF